VEAFLRLCRWNARSARFTDLKMRLAADRPRAWCRRSALNLVQGAISIAAVVPTRAQPAPSGPPAVGIVEATKRPITESSENSRISAKVIFCGRWGMPSITYDGCLLALGNSLSRFRGEGFGMARHSALGSNADH
jgi:hypothetical protein